MHRAALTLLRRERGLTESMLDSRNAFRLERFPNKLSGHGPGRVACTGTAGRHEKKPHLFRETDYIHRLADRAELPPRHPSPFLINPTSNNCVASLHSCFSMSSGRLLRKTGFSNDYTLGIHNWSAINGLAENQLFVRRHL